MNFFTAQQTAELLPFDVLVVELRKAVVEYANGQILSPERMVVPLREGGVMLSMPATADDIATHKLVNVQPANKAQGLSTIHGQVAAFDSGTGAPLFTLDGPTVTGRRTAAVSMLGIETLLPVPPRSILIVGAGTQAGYHVEAIQSLYPETDIWIRSISDQDARDFCTRHQGRKHGVKPWVSREMPETVDVVITVTTSSVPVYDEAAKPGRLVIAVGAFTPQLAEIGTTTIQQSRLLVDDLAGARHEAGDFIQANVNWAEVQPLSAVIEAQAQDNSERAIVFKTVGCAAWDLAACRTAQAILASHAP